MKNLIVIVGPTAVGKTALAVAMAKMLKTEILSADSRQVYREMTIGTAKPSTVEQDGVVHHFIDSHSIHQPLDAATFGESARACLKKLFQDHESVIVCGGSGLYVQALLQGFDEMPHVPPALRQSIVENYHTHGLTWLQQQVQQHDPVFFQQVDRQNPQRLMRALELLQVTRQPLDQLRKGDTVALPYEQIKIGLELPRPVLYGRINQRVETMLEQGLWREAETVYAFRDKTPLQTVGYQEIFTAMDGAIDGHTAVELIKRNTRRYAKRQLTWFKRDAAIRWFDAHDHNTILSWVSSQLHQI